MTLREAIDKACNGNYYIKKDEYTKTYRNATDQFWCGYVNRAFRIIKDSSSKVSIYNDGSGDTYYKHKPSSSTYLISIATNNTSKQYVIRLTAKKEGEGWYIQISNPDGILDCENLHRFVSVEKLTELQEELENIQNEINEINKSMIY